MRRLVLVSALGLIFVGGCSPTRAATPPSALPGTAPTCAPVPAGFHESNLTGTWVVNYGGTSRQEKLEIRADHNYRQLFVNSNTNYHYEGEWSDWRVEFLGSGMAYVHFTGMKVCDFEESCRNVNEFSGGLPFYDFCGNRYFNFNNEMVVAVAGSQAFALAEDTPLGIVLAEMKPPGWDGPYFFFVLEIPG